MKIKVKVKYKEGVFDPEMSTLQNLLHRRDMKEVLQIQQEKIYFLSLSEELSKEKAQKLAQEIGETYLSHPEIHDCEVELETKE